MVEEQFEEDKIDHPEFDKPRFTRKSLSKPIDVVSIRMNDNDRTELIEFKKMLAIDTDSGAYKMALTISKNVIHQLFGDKMMTYLASGRLRPKNMMFEENLKR